MKRRTFLAALVGLVTLPALVQAAPKKPTPGPDLKTNIAKFLDYFEATYKEPPTTIHASRKVRQKLTGYHVHNSAGNVIAIVGHVKGTTAPDYIRISSATKAAWFKVTR